LSNQFFAQHFVKLPPAILFLPQTHVHHNPESIDRELSANKHFCQHQWPTLDGAF